MAPPRRWRMRSGSICSRTRRSSNLSPRLSNTTSISASLRSGCWRRARGSGSARPSSILCWAPKGSSQGLAAVLGSDRTRGAKPGTSLDVSYTQAGVALAWELDFWGRVRRLEEESARAQYLATEEGRRGVVVSLIGDVAGEYFTLREGDLELDIAGRTRDIAAQNLKLVQLRHDRGAATGLDVTRPSNFCTPPRRSRRRRAGGGGDREFTQPAAGQRTAAASRGGRRSDHSAAARTAAGVALSPDRAASRYPAGGAEPDRRQRADWRGERAVLAADWADGFVGGQRRVLSVVYRPEPCGTSAIGAYGRYSGPARSAQTCAMRVATTRVGAHLPEEHLSTRVERCPTR